MTTPQIDTLASAEPFIAPCPKLVRGIKRMPITKPAETITPTYDEMHPSRFVINGYGCSIERVMAI